MGRAPRSRYFMEGEKPIPSGQRHGQEPQPRIIAFMILVLVTFAMFGIRILWLQTAEGAHYQDLADQNRYKLVALEAPRGVMYDRNGQILVRNEPAFDIAITPALLPDGEESPSQRYAVYARLAALLNMPVSAASAATTVGEPAESGIREIVEQAEVRAPFQTVVIRENVSQDVAFAVAESQISLPGVSIAVHARRYYPAGGLTGDLVGYTAPIPEETAADYVARGYDPATDRVGAAGLELSLQDVLSGTKGFKYVETDVAGRVLRTVGQPQAPVPGNNVVLTIDLNLQRIAREALLTGMAKAEARLGHEIRQGVVVALDPRNGEVLAMVSVPDYDNNAFAQGISTYEWDRLNNDPYTPLINHAIIGQYPPGSTFKLVTASGVLQEDVVASTTKVFDPGVIYLPNRYAPNDPGSAQRFVCWNHAGHGWLDIVGAIEHSCDVYFYKVGGGYADENIDGLGDRRLAEYARAYGFGAPTGIELPYEATGLVPDNTWKRKTLAESWSTGDTYNFSIGQGFLTVTPLQLAGMVATVANGGTLYQPHVVQQIVAPDGAVLDVTQPEIVRQVPVSAENLALIRRGMRLAVTEGTAASTVWPQNIAAAGKTGTAEFCDDLAQKSGLCVNGRVLPTHAWFVSFAPYDNPQIVLVVFLYNGGEGSTFAAPVAAEIYSKYFNQPLVAPTPRPPTATPAAPTPEPPTPTP